VPVEEAMPKIGLGTKIFRWLVITRAPFLTAAIVPILIGAAWVAARGVSPFPWLAFALTMVGGVAMQVAANTFNDYFDWRSGTDPANNDYFLPLSGGSRSIELGLITEKALFRAASIALAIGAAAGLALVALRGPAVILFGVVGAFSVYFYTAPPLRLAARHGLGELVVGMNFGPLMVAGTVFALTGAVSWVDFFVGLPVGLLITAVLWINQFPDAQADEETGKINLVVALGKERARWGYLLMVFGAFVAALGGVVAGLLPLGALLMLVALPIAVYTTATLFRYYADRRLVSANQFTIVLHMLGGLLLAAGVLWGERLIGLVS
jgi:1,4-dihydroxy-2-naphthoate octaprenyltransferase